jgi:DNA-binding transcriptional ArsR family regulator
MSSAADATVFHAIADPTRRAILDLLREGERSVSTLLTGFRMSQPALSQHLAVLRRAGLVTNRRDGRRRLYRLRAEPLREVVDWVAVFEEFWSERMDNLGRYLESQRSGAPGADPSGADHPAPGESA